VIFVCDPVLGSFPHLHLDLARALVIYFLRTHNFFCVFPLRFASAVDGFAFKTVALQLVLPSAVHLFNNILSFFRDPPVLKAFNNTDVILRLPMGKRIRDIRWLSVWCRRFTVGTDRHLLLQLCVCVCVCVCAVVLCECEWGAGEDIVAKREKVTAESDCGCSLASDRRFCYCRWVFAYHQ
jgi:hypothetical protein